ncbi:MAG: sigma-70 family RNA polymerase sigma factor [Elusimicrobiota bacterium]
MDSLDPLKLYFQQIRKIPRLSADEFDSLWKLWMKTGNRRAKERLIEGNQRLVITLAKRYHRWGMEFLDLIEEGNLGMLRALEKYNPRKGNRFSTYAAYWIDQAMRRAMDTQSKTIRIPPHAWEGLRKWIKEWDKLRGQYGRAPTMTEMSSRLGLSAREMKSIMELNELTKSLSSLDAPINLEENLYLKDVIPDGEKNSPEHIISLLRANDDLSKVIDQLSPKEKAVIQMRFGLNDGKRLTLDEVGRRFKLSRERIRQIEHKALLRLRRFAQRKGLIQP